MPSPCHRVVSLEEKLYPHCLSLPRYWLLGYPCSGLASHPGGSSNTLSCFLLQKPGQTPVVWASLAHVRLFLLPLPLNEVVITPIHKENSRKGKSCDRFVRDKTDWLRKRQLVKPVYKCFSFERGSSHFTVLQVQKWHFLQWKPLKEFLKGAKQASIYGESFIYPLNVYKL